MNAGYKSKVVFSQAANNIIFQNSQPQQYLVLSQLTSNSNSHKNMLSSQILEQNLEDLKSQIKNYSYLNENTKQPQNKNTSLNNSHEKSYAYDIRGHFQQQNEIPEKIILQEKQKEWLRHCLEIQIEENKKKKQAELRRIYDEDQIAEERFQRQFLQTQSKNIRITSLQPNLNVYNKVKISTHSILKKDDRIKIKTPSSILQQEIKKISPKQTQIIDDGKLIKKRSGNDKLASITNEFQEALQFEALKTKRLYEIKIQMEHINQEKKKASNNFFQVRDQLRSMMMHKVADPWSDDINQPWNFIKTRAQTNEPAESPMFKSKLPSPKFNKNSDNIMQLRPEINSEQIIVHQQIDQKKNNLLSFLEETIVNQTSNDKTQNNVDTTMIQNNTTILNNTLHLNLSQLSSIETVLKEDNDHKFNNQSRNQSFNNLEEIDRRTNQDLVINDIVQDQGYLFQNQQPRQHSIYKISTHQDTAQYTKHTAIAKEEPGTNSRRTQNSKSKERKSNLNQLLSIIQDKVSKEHPISKKQIS